MNLYTHACSSGISACILFSRLPNTEEYRRMPRTAFQPFPIVLLYPEPLSTTTPTQLRTPSMPPNLRSAIPKTLSRPLDSRGVFYCPSCATWRRTFSTRRNNHHRTSTSTTSTGSSPPRRGGQGRHNQRHEFTTAASSSVVNAGKNVPPRFRELYAALNRVGDVAPERVNLSRLQLALRGLEVEEPLVRVAGELFRLPGREGKRRGEYGLIC